MYKPKVLGSYTPKTKLLGSYTPKLLGSYTPKVLGSYKPSWCGCMQACSGIVDRTSDPAKETAYVFCSAWDRANHTCPEYTRARTAGNFTWGCGSCSKPGGCYVGAWTSDDMRSWVGPSIAVPPAEVAKLRRPPWGDVAHHNHHPPVLQLPTNVAAASQLQTMLTSRFRFFKMAPTIVI